MVDGKDPRSTLRAIAIFEAVKGLAALAGLIAVLDLLHRDVRPSSPTWRTSSGSALT